VTRKLEIDWMALDGAFQTGSGGLVEMYHYLDLDTGEVVMLTDEVTRYLEEPPERELPEWILCQSHNERLPPVPSHLCPLCDTLTHAPFRFSPLAGRAPSARQGLLRMHSASTSYLSIDRRRVGR
jgi:hypothetical protein